MRTVRMEFSAKIVVICALFSMIFIASSANARPARLLGETELNRLPDGDVIFVSGKCPSAINSPVSAVGIRAVRNDAEIDYLAVRYGNGVVDELQVREHFRQGIPSRWIDLRLGRRCVEQIRIFGRTTGPGPKAVVEVYGAK